MKILLLVLTGLSSLSVSKTFAESRSIQQITINLNSANDEWSKTDLKTEEVVNVHCEIFDVTTKTQVLANTQTTTNITEKVFLDKLKNASETQQKIRREGLEFRLNPDGTVTLKSKKQENKLTYNPAEKKYK